MRDVIVGNEPNLNRFWLPQFGPEGENVSAAAYLRLLAATYDAVKAARDDVRVWAGATAPRGSDRPGADRATTSPTTFIRALGTAYRQSGRDKPVMDGFVHHPYPESAVVPIDLPHPRVRTIGLADYDKLVRLLSDAFDGTPQKGSDLPILYGEIGVETAIPADKRRVYSDREIARTTSEQAQADAYRRTLELAACQPNVAGVLFFHLRDEPSLTGWQSGVRYADGTAKQSVAPVRAALRGAAGRRARRAVQRLAADEHLSEAPPACRSVARGRIGPFPVRGGLGRSQAQRLRESCRFPPLLLPGPALLDCLFPPQLLECLA